MIARTTIAEPRSAPVDMDRFVGSAVSPVRVVGPAKFIVGSSSPYRAASAVLADTIPTLGISLTQPGGGYGFEVRQVRASAIGESLERYATCWVDEEALHWPESIDLSEFNDLLSYSRIEQAALNTRLDSLADEERSRVPLVEVENMHDGSVRKIPAALVWMGRKTKAELSLVESNSSGVALATSSAEAFCGAALELLERDAILSAWFAQAPSSVVALESARLPPKVIDYLDRENIRLHLRDVSWANGVPVCLVAVEDANFGTLAFGSSAKSTLQRAARHATVEALGTLQWAREIAVRDGIRPSSAGSFEDHVAQTVRREDWWRASRILDVADHARTRELSPNWNVQAGEILDIAKESGITLYAKDVTTCDLAEAGLSVMRVVGSNIVPLAGSDSFRRTGAPRLDRLLAERASGVHLEPHPFP